MSAVANRYAKALADVVAEQGQTDQVKDSLGAFYHLVSGHEELQRVFRNPTIPLAQKRGVLNALLARLKPLPVVANFLAVLLENQRIQQLGEIVAAFNRELDRRLGVVSAEVTTAGPITDAERRQLSDRLARLTGKQVRLQFSVDAEIIGGVVTRIGSVIYDGSIRNQLEQIKIRLREE